LGLSRALPTGKALLFSTRFLLTFIPGMLYWSHLLNKKERIMSSYMYHEKSKFRIDADKRADLMQAIKRINHLAPYAGREVDDKPPVVQAFLGWNWKVSIDEETGAIDSIWFLGESFQYDDHLMEAIAPFVDDGSYIEMYGEGGAKWRWLFKEGKYEEIYPTITWENE
jgi:hypothetical protein